MLHYAKLERLARDEHSNPFVTYVMNGLNTLVLHCTKVERLARDKYYSLLDPSISNEEN
jgi:hypothetical protein